MAWRGLFNMPKRKPLDSDTNKVLTFPESKRQAPGRIKIANAVKKLLRSKSYNTITWGEIARTAGVSEALIYQHFKDREGLLCGVIGELLDKYIQGQRQSLQGTYGALNKLRRIMWSHLNQYNQDRVFAKILLLEVRSFSRFFDSEAYQVIQEYGAIILDIIKEGVYNHEIRDDVAPEHIRQMILGTIEHMCMPMIIYDRKFSTDELTDEACRIIFSGILAPGSPLSPQK
jgi:TetR/AcrR family fatty acid metabolism transcriptional regulator